jgi:hypothetical protein
MELYVRSRVLWPFGFRGSIVKLCCLLPSWDMFLMFHGESRGGECHGNEIWGLAMVVQIFMVMRNLLGNRDS